MIDRTHFAASSDITHHHLNGVYFECLEKPMIRMIATEGHRLSYVDQDVFLMETDLKQGVVIPKKGLLEFRKLLVESDETVGISFDRGYLFVKFPHSYFFVRLIEGDYPDYRTVMPKELHPFMMTLHKVDFISALKRASLLTHEKSRAVHFKINTHTLTISASHSEIGETHEEVSIEYQGEPMEISFNAKYLLDNLAVLKSEKITFALKDRLSSGILKELSDPSHTYIVMPMRL
jgi:DNA polymerase-3 subunit beta